MSSKENLNKAVFDMFGVGSNPDVKGDYPAKTPAVPTRENPFALSHVSPAPAASGVTYLAPGTAMEGHLKAKGNVDVAGEFKGDIITSGCVNLRSNIDGNITADKLDVVACTLTGDVHIAGIVTIDASSTVTGNIFAGELLCAGKVAGNLRISGNSSLQKNARIHGDISTGTLTMERGALINGGLTMNARPTAEKQPAEFTAPAKPAEEKTAVEKPVVTVH